MFLRLALAIATISQALLANDFSTDLFTSQSVGNLHNLNQRALNRQIRSSLLGKQPVSKNSLPPVQTNPLLSGHAKMESVPECAIPLAQVKIDNTKHYFSRSFKTAKPNFDPIAKAAPVPAFDPIAKAAPVPACKH